jgi:FAD/FMN-containing dehydrogenase
MGATKLRKTRGFSRRMNDTSAPLPAGTLAALRGIVGEAQLRTGEAVAALDPGGLPENLDAGVVVTPGTVEEVAAVVALCGRENIGIVPHGGRTGLVGGGVSRLGMLVLSTARLNRIERLDPVSRIAVVQTGVTLQALQEAALAHRLEPGIDLPSRGTATIGGMVSTNAGGMMAFRNGVTRHRILGLEAVLADGSVYSDLTQVVKNSAGYDLKHLFIGAEGTLGVVTRAVLKLDPVPAASATALFSLPSVGALLETIRRALDSEVGALRAAEAMWRPFFSLTSAAHGFADAALDRTAPVFLLLSLGGPDEAAMRAGLERLFEQTLDRHPEATGLVAQSLQQERTLWELREDTHAMYRVYPQAPSYDVSMPLGAVEAYVARIGDGIRAIDRGLEPLVFGHLADGNLHIVLNRAGPLPSATIGAVEGVLYAGLAAAGGSFSAEHGVGSKRIHALAATAAPAKLATMRRIKQLLDPQNLFNPGKVLP